MNKGYIYKLECPDLYFYIGSTIKNISKRFTNHKSDYKRGIKNIKLYEHIRLHSFEWNNIKISILEEVIYENINELLLKESNYIENNIKNNLCLNVRNPYDKNKKHNINNIGRIYKLICNDGHYYIGSTIQTLDKRLYNHKTASKNNKTKLYDHINKIGWNNVKIELIEELTINNRNELYNKEYIYIKQLYSLLCLNTHITIDDKERKFNREKYEKNKKEEYIKQKRFYEENKIKKEDMQLINNNNKIISETKILNKQEKLKEYKRQYYLNNKEKLNKLQKEYNIKNKDKKEKYIREYYKNNLENFKLRHKINYIKRRNEKKKIEKYFNEHNLNSNNVDTT